MNCLESRALSNYLILDGDWLIQSDPLLRSMNIEPKNMNSVCDERSYRSKAGSNWVALPMGH